MNETQLTNKIQDYIRSIGGYEIKVFGGGFQRAGVPDILACINGHFVAIEVKSPSGKGRASLLQKQNIMEIRKAGGIAFFTDNYDECIEILNDGLYERESSEKYFALADRK